MYKVLVVEDEKLIRKRLVYGYDYEKMNCLVVGEARDGKEGIELIKDLHPDIVITDINMPIMDAFDMLEETIDFLYSTIILSSYDEFENAQKAIKYGVSEFIVKPIEEAELKQALERAIKQLRVQQESQKVKNERMSLQNLSFIDEKVYGAEDEVVKEMLEYIKKNYGKRFVFKDVAEHIGYSQTLLHNRFKEQTKMTFNEYLNRYRIQQAIEKLKNKDEKIYEVAASCGFSEYKYFNKVFKKYVGMSASTFNEKM